MGLTILLLMGCATKPKGLFQANLVPPAPDYSDIRSWAAHPSVFDSADLIPNASLQNQQEDAPIDVFFLHPTTYTHRNGNRSWNATTYDQELNERTNKFPIKFQASAFNNVGRIYAPYYRQAHIESYYTKKKQSSASRALDIAYLDVKRAFEHYLEVENQDRPFIIAAHSQGTHHAVRLVKELIDGKPIQNQLIVAYLVGMPVRKNEFQSLAPCEEAEDVECYCSWRTWKTGHLPKSKQDTFTNVLVTNPLTWKTSGAAPKSANEGTLLRNFEKLYVPGLTNAEVSERVLWVDKPKFPWSFLFTMNNYHVADYNFFWMNIRQNAIDRRDSFINQRGG